jgi:hypothetical protein
MRGTGVTVVLDILGVLCLAGFAGAIWWPACLLVVGAALLLASWRSTS